MGTRGRVTWQRVKLRGAFEMSCYRYIKRTGSGRSRAARVRSPSTSANLPLRPAADRFQHSSDPASSPDPCRERHHTDVISIQCCLCTCRPHYPKRLQLAHLCTQPVYTTSLTLDQIMVLCNLLQVWVEVDYSRGPPVKDDWHKRVFCQDGCCIIIFIAARHRLAPT